MDGAWHRGSPGVGEINEKRGGQSISPPSLNRLEGNYPLVKHSDLEFGSWSPSSRADSAGQVPPLENADNS